VPAPQSSAIIAGRYELLRPVGSGGMGEVWEARHLALDARVAIKFLKKPSPSDAAGRARFSTEAQVTARLRTRYAVQVFDYGVEEDGQPFLVMELLEGETLAERLRAAGRLSIEATVTFLRQAARALERAHALGIVHRDLKPENLFLVRDDEGREQIKVMDFGIAKLVGTLDPRGAAPGSTPVAPSSVTGTGAALGTPRYMAPEQIDHAAELGPAADVWALGVVAFECLTGKSPFDGPDVATIFANIRRGQRPPVRALDAALPEELDAWLDGACARDPADRFESPVAAVRELAACLGVPEEREPSGPAIHAEGLRAPRPSEPAATLSSTQSASEQGVVRFAGDGVATAPRRSWARTLVVGGLLIAMGGGVSLYVSRLGAPSASAPAALASASEATVPAGAREASVAYAEGMQAFRDGSTSPARRALERAAALDPSLASVPLHLALFEISFARVILVDPDEASARALYQRASRLRSALPKFESALLEACAPRFEQVSDLAAWESRLLALSEAFPGNAEALHWLAEARLERGDLPGARSALAQELAADPAYTATALALRGRVERHDTAQALAAYDECLARAPGAVDCMAGRLMVHDLAADCAAMEVDARAWVSADPAEARAYEVLREALTVTGAPVASLREVTRAGLEHIAESDRPRAELEARFALSMIAGDFDDARAAARVLVDAVPAGASVGAHFGPSMMLTWVFQETGDGPGVAAAGADFMSRARAWTPGSAREVAMPLFFLRSMYRFGTLPEADFVAERGRWVGLGEDLWRRAGARSGQGPFLLWLSGYALPATTKKEALAALDLAGRYEPMPSPSATDASTNVVIARTLALAGQPERALPYARQAGSTCEGFTQLYAVMMGRLQLAEILAARGEREPARAELRKVLDRWGAAKSSTTAAKASALLARLARE
jgi:eukaryotic-like serine/threonine-protein kinase